MSKLIKTFLPLTIILCLIISGTGYYFLYWRPYHPRPNLNPAQIKEWQEKLKIAKESIKTNSSCQKNEQACYSFWEETALAKQMLGDLAGAIKAYKTAAGLDPTNYFSYVSLADIYQDLKKYEKAEKYYEKAIEMRPEENIGYLKLGELYYNKIPEKKDQAEKIWRQGMVKSNNHFPLILRLADWFYETGKLEEAESFYQAYLNYDPDNERAREMLYKANREK